MYLFLKIYDLQNLILTHQSLALLLTLRKFYLHSLLLTNELHKFVNLHYKQTHLQHHYLLQNLIEKIHQYF